MPVFLRFPDKKPKIAGEKMTILQEDGRYGVFLSHVSEYGELYWVFKYIRHYDFGKDKEIQNSGSE